MPEIASNIKRNARDRINAVPILVTKPMDTVLESVSKVIALQPVKAATFLLEHAGDGVVSFVNTQADISRRWMA